MEKQDDNVLDIMVSATYEYIDGETVRTGETIKQMPAIDFIKWLAPRLPKYPGGASVEFE